MTPSLLPLLDAVLDAVALPVVAAGGIATARGVAAALAAGASGAVRVGTRFIAAAESDAHPDWVAAVLDAAAADAVVSDAYNAGLVPPGPHRVLRSALDAAETLPDGTVATLRLAGAEIPVPRFGPQPPDPRLDGRDRRDGALRRPVGRRGPRGDARRRDRRRARDRCARKSVALELRDWLSRMTRAHEDGGRSCARRTCQRHSSSPEA